MWLLEDLLSSPLVPHNNYIRVKYEDLQANPIKTIIDLYDFIGVPVSTEMLEEAKQHFNAKGKQGKTYRSSDFDNGDLKRLPLKIKTEIEYKCEGVLNILNYSS